MTTRRNAAPASAGVMPERLWASAGVRVTVTGAPVFAFGRWFQPGETLLPPHYLAQTQLDALCQLDRVQVSATP